MRKEINGSFTLIELLVVIAIIGILAGIIIASLMHGSAVVRQAKAQAEIEQITKILLSYKAVHKDYPIVEETPCDLSLADSCTELREEIPDLPVTNEVIFYDSDGDDFSVITVVDDVTYEATSEVPEVHSARTTCEEGWILVPGNAL